MKRRAIRWATLLASVLLLPAGLALAGGSAGAQTTTPTTSTCGGAPQGIPGTWTCSFDDEFNGSALNTAVWTVQRTSNSGYHSGLECFENTPDNVSVSGGTLNLTVRKVAKPFLCTGSLGTIPYLTQYTSGMVSTYKTFSQTYGVFQVRAEIPAATVRGLQESFWLYPTQTSGIGPLTSNGEIDIAEIFSQYPNLAIPTVHNNVLGMQSQVSFDHCVIVNPSTQFHTYGVDWTPTTISFVYDGKTCLVDHIAGPSLLGSAQNLRRPYLIALTQVLGIGTNNFEPNVTPLPATTRIDWVRVWR